MEKYDDFMWVKRVIDSCTEVSHLRSIDRLCFNFNRKHNDFNLYLELDGYVLSHVKKMRLEIENQIKSKQPIFR